MTTRMTASEIETYLEPQNNSALSGLYKSDSYIVTQCESQGFRRITPFLDRPDVMAKYTVRIEGDEKKLPSLLANGNMISAKSLGNGRHEATFHDPWPKPSYLFATANSTAGFSSWPSRKTTVNTAVGTAASNIPRRPPSAVASWPRTTSSTVAAVVPVRWSTPPPRSGTARSATA